MAASSSAAMYNDLVTELLHPDHALCNAVVGTTDICDADKIAKMLVILFESRDQSLMLMGQAVAREVNATEQHTVLFRGNSIASKMMTVFSRLRGMDYLKAVLLPPMKAVIDSDASFEIDPTRAAAGEDLVANARHLFTHIQAFLDSFLNSLSLVPPAFRQLCAVLMTTCSAKFPESRHTSVGGYIFLRFICPAVVSPTAYNLVTQFPKKSSHRGLIFIAKALQNIANNITSMDTKEAAISTNNPVVVEINQYMEQCVPRLNAFFEELASVPLTSAPSARASAAVDAAGILDSCVQLQRHLSANSDRVAVLIGEGKTAGFAAIMARLAEAVSTAESSRAKPGESEDVAAPNARDGGQVLNMQMEWRERAGHPCDLVISLLARFEAIVRAHVSESLLRGAAMTTLTSATGGAAGDLSSIESMQQFFAGRPIGSLPAGLEDPVDWSKLGSSIDFSELELDACELQKVDLKTLTARRDIFCFYINVYNLLLLHSRVAEGRMPTSVSQRKAFFANYKFRLGGLDFSLDDLFHGVLRGNPRQQIKHTDPRMEFVLTNYDPRVHFAISQLNASSPPIRVYSREGVFQQMLWAARAYCTLAVSTVAEKRTIYLPKLFDLYNTDFGAFRSDVWSVLGLWLSGELRDTLSEFLKTGKHKTQYNDVDYGVRIPVFATEQDKRDCADMIAESQQNNVRASVTAMPTSPTDARPQMGLGSGSGGAAGPEDADAAPVAIDLDEMWVLNVDMEWFEAVRPALEVSVDLVTQIGRLCKTFMFGWTSVAGSQQFKDYILVAGELQRVNVAVLSVPDRVAFFCNVFNALATHLYVMLGPPTSMFSRKSFLRKFRYNIGGFSYCLEDILFGVLGAGGKKARFKKADPRLAIALPEEAFDPRVHFACSTLTKSAGPVRVYRGASLDAELSAQMAAVMNAQLEVKPEKNKIYLPKTIELNLADFCEKKDDAYTWSAPFIPPAQREVIDEIKAAKKLRIWYRDLSWDPNPVFLL